MPIYTNDPFDDGFFPVEPSLRSSLGIGPKVTKAIDDATKDWLDKHPEATTTVEDDSITNVKLKDGSVNSRVIEDESITTDDIADLAVTTPKIADNAVDATKIASTAADGLRTMSASQPGVAKVGAGLAMNNGALELNGGDIAPAVSDWLNMHPEATTTVQDGSITLVKLNSSLLSKLLSYKGIVYANSDMNDYQSMGLYLINLSAADYATVAHAPSRSMLGTSSALYMEVFNWSTSTNLGLVCQRIYASGYPDASKPNNTVMRWGNNVNDVFTWFDWNAESYTATEIDNKLASISTQFKGQVATNGDMNNYQEAGFYLINKSQADYATIANAPSPAMLDYGYTGLYMDVYNITLNENSGLICQRIHTSGYNTVAKANNTVVRWGNKIGDNFVWFDWHVESYTASNIDNKLGKVIHVGPTREYTSLLEGIIEAERSKNSTVIVDSGTYDAVSEFKALYGDDYFTSENYTQQTNYRGIPLINGVHVVGFGGVTVTGGLEATDAADAIAWWSIFNTGDSSGGDDGFGFTLENIEVKATNARIRYLVHDENGGTDYSYINKYINCRFTLPSGATNKCIGGGLGQHGYIVIDNCVVSAPSYINTLRGINYHNNFEANSLSEIYVKNCCFLNGTVGITWYGNTAETEKSILYVSNCYLRNAPIKQAENSSAVLENVDIVAWNNEIES